MIHEVLMHLLNYLDHGNEIMFSEMEEFLHPGEILLLQQIVDNISNYRRLMDFCTKVKQVNNNLQTASEVNDAKLKGEYIEAFANGILFALEDYTNDLYGLESKYLENPQLSLHCVTNILNKHKSTFEFITSAVDLLQRDQIYGCLLMGKLHSFIDRGMPCKDIPAKLTQGFSTIFYSQLSNWIIYGDLVDRYSEFFICDGQCADENFLYSDQLDEPSASFSHLSLSMKKTRIQRPPIVRKFYINWQMVPLFIKQDVAESILFMGRIVWVLKNDPRKNTHYLKKDKANIWDVRDSDYYNKLQEYDKKQFDEKQFEVTIEECRLKITKYLWSIMLEEGKLKEHLHLIRDYYALGRGELFYQFLVEAEREIGNINIDHSLRNLNKIFVEMARKMYGENDSSYMKFELALTKEEKQSNPWSRLILNFDISWPLHIIFHPKTIELYNNLFAYLLRLKKTQINLQKLWRMHHSQKIDAKVWSLRQKLMFLVYNLDYYIQVDVIEVQFSILLKAVENANEFGDIIKVHHQFVSNLLAKSFVLTPDASQTVASKNILHQKPAVQFNVPSKVFNVIINLLNLCDQFCQSASTWAESLTVIEASELEAYRTKADTIVECLLYILNMHYQKSNQHYLVQLLHQLDFNKFFSRTKPNCLADNAK